MTFYSLSKIIILILCTHARSLASDFMNVLFSLHLHLAKNIFEFLWLQQIHEIFTFMDVQTVI